MNGSMLSIILLTVALSLLVFILTDIIFSAVLANKIAADKRLEDLNKKEGDGDALALVKNESKKTKREREKKRQKSDRMEKLGEKLYQELQSADIKMRPEEFLLIWIVVGFVPGGLYAMFSANVTVALILFGVGIAAPYIVLRMKKKQRVKKFDAQLSDALMLACSSLKSGLSFNQAMESIARDMEAPISTEFDITLREISMGYSMDEALDNMARRINSKYLALMVSAVLVQRQTGGNLSQILENISETIKKKFKLLKQLKSATSGGKMSGMIVAALPFGLLGLFILVNPDIYKMVLTENRGHILLFIAIGLEACAFAMIKKITTIKM